MVNKWDRESLEDDKQPERSNGVTTHEFVMILAIEIMENVQYIRNKCLLYYA